ncbi:MAG: hypothetical protein ACD_7C00166G0002 [uncultured bacterium]|nr:MAG: hypothetical protein ACD_7C00166G0002 [uncultured bacterium]HBR79812.1 hypothetical protein [Candidatus Moranbacteria bacterium]
MFKGLLESESLLNLDILSELEIIGSHQEFFPEQKTKIVTVNKLKISDQKIKLVIDLISKKYIKPEWYALFWDNKIVYVVFEDTIFKLKNTNPWDLSEIKLLTKYATSNGILKKHIDEMRLTMINFDSPRANNSLTNR